MNLDLHMHSAQFHYFIRDINGLFRIWNSQKTLGTEDETKMDERKTRGRKNRNKDSSSMGLSGVNVTQTESQSTKYLICYPNTRQTKNLAKKYIEALISSAPYEKSFIVR